MTRLQYKAGFFPVIFLLTLFWLNSPVLALEKEEQSTSFDTTFVVFQPLSVTVFKDSRVHGLLAVSFSLSVSDVETLEKAHKLQPRLRDAYIRILTRLAGVYFDVNRPVNLDVLDKALQRVSDQMLGDGHSDILIQSATVRPL